MSKHTPGPWKYDGIKHVFLDDVPFQKIAEINRYLPEFEDESDANARLIATAPQLLEALMMALDDSEVMAPDGKPLCVGPDTLTRMRAAIKAATGEA